MSISEGSILYYQISLYKLEIHDTGHLCNLKMSLYTLINI